MKKTLVFSGLIALMVSIITVGGFGYWMKNEKTINIQHIDATPTSSVVYTKDDSGNFRPLDFTATSEKVVNAVVHIKSTQMMDKNNMRGFQQQGQIPDAFKDLFGDRFFGPNRRFQQQQSPLEPQARVGTGSGVIVNEKGYIITNNHVIENAQDIEVTLHDNRNYKAKVIGTDPTTDIAVLQIKAEDLPTLPFVNSDRVKVGEWVLAVGNPFSLNSTVTAGIVSAKGRNININKEQYAVEDFIQTDAAINPGNSGGALVNLDGGLIGINTAIASRTGAYNGYGFAVPSNMVQKVMADLIQYGSVQRGVLGVMIRNVDGNLAKDKDLNITQGVYVDSLMENSAAGIAGILKGDVIVKVDDITVDSAPELQGLIARHHPGEKVRITVNRKGSEKSIDVVLKSRTNDYANIDENQATILKSLGAKFESLDKDIAKKLDIEGGVKVSQLYSGKIKLNTNMREGFIITKVNGKKVKDIDKLVKILEDHKGGVMLEGVYEDIPGVYYYAFGLS